MRVVLLFPPRIAHKKEMKPGPRPKPTNLKKLQGNPGKRRFNKREPKPRASGVELNAMTEREAKFRDAIAPVLRTANLMTDADVPAFEMMTVHFAIAQEAAELIHRLGITTRKDGRGKKRPLLQVLRDNSTAFRAYAVEFGMTPSSRTRISLPQDDHEPSLEEQLFAMVGGARVKDGGN